MDCYCYSRWVSAYLYPESKTETSEEKPSLSNICLTSNHFHFQWEIRHDRHCSNVEWQPSSILISLFSNATTIKIIYRINLLQCFQSNFCSKSQINQTIYPFEDFKHPGFFFLKIYSFKRQRESMCTHMCGVGTGRDSDPHWTQWGAPHREAQSHHWRPRPKPKSRVDQPPEPPRHPMIKSFLCEEMLK